MKRYCQTLDLRDDPEMIEKYCEAHAHVWPEIQAGIREVGILDMQIFRSGRKLFMIMDTVDDFDFVKDDARLATLPRQAEWEAYVAQFQGCDPDAPSTAKWQLMDKIIELEKTGGAKSVGSCVPRVAAIHSRNAFTACAEWSGR